MSLVRFSPFAELETVQSQMNRLLDEFASWQDEDKSAWRPAIELRNGDFNLTLKASLPGILADDVDVSLTRESVRITGEYKYNKQSEESGVYHSEFRYGKFDRSIVLPVAIDHENVTADFTDGILTLTLPKIVPTSKKVVKLSLNKPASAETTTEETSVNLDQ